MIGRTILHSPGQRPLLAAVMSLLILVLPLCAANAQSQADSPQHTDAGASSKSLSELDMVVVTATRVQRPGFEAPTPTVVVGDDLLRDRAPAALIDAFSQLPASRGTSTRSTAGNTGSSGPGGGSLLNLRGLGYNRTLVLLNGQRVVATNTLGATDISLFPRALVSQADVVTGGASAAYGSDAVAGVANFKLDTHYQGFKGDTQGGISSAGDAITRKASLTWGAQFGERTHLVVSGEYFQDAGVAPTARDFNTVPIALANNPAYAPGNGQKPQLYAPFAYAPNMTLGGVIVGGPLANAQFLPAGSAAPYVPCTPQGAAYQLCSGKRGDLISLGSAIDLSAPDKRGSTYGRLTFDVAEGISAYADILYGRNRTNYSSWPAFTLIQGLVPIHRDNAYLPAATASLMDQAGVSSFNLGRYSTDMYLANFIRDDSLTRGSIGIDAAFGNGWTLSAYVAYDDAQLDSLKEHAINAARFSASADSVIDPATGQPACRSTLTNPSNGCVPVDLFGYGSPSQAATNYIEGLTWAHLRLTEVASGINVSGEPLSTWAGPVSVALGGEARRESAHQTVDPLSLAKAWVSTNYAPLDGRYNVKEVYAETVVPLAEKIALVRLLELNAAARLTDYSTSGTVTTWKIGANYEPFSGVRFRGTASRDIRAPDILELDSPPAVTSAVAGVVDPRTKQTVLVQSWTSGNANLQPEKADTVSAGVVLSPAWLPDLSLSLDYYNIFLKNAISTLSIQSIANGCAGGSGALCGLIDHDAAGNITRITSAYLNLNSIRTSGIDLDALYRWRLGGSRGISFHWLGNLEPHYRVRSLAGETDYAGDLGTYSLPKLSMDLEAAYSDDISTFMLMGKFIGGGRISIDSQALIQNNDVAGVWYFNTIYRRRFQVGTSRMEAFVGVDNILNRAPPAAYFGSTGGNYDRIGRYFKLGVHFEL